MTINYTPYNVKRLPSGVLSPTTALGVGATAAEESIAGTVALGMLAAGGTAVRTTWTVVAGTVVTGTVAGVTSVSLLRTTLATMDVPQIMKGTLVGVDMMHKIAPNTLLATL